MRPVAARQQPPTVAPELIPSGLMLLPVLCLLPLSACSNLAPTPIDQHLIAHAPSSAGSPAPFLDQIPLPPSPRLHPAAELYSVTVRDMPASELLHALARDTGRNIDIHPDIQGKVSMHLVDQTLEEILTRLGQQLSLRHEFQGDTLIIQPDTAYVHHYSIDYPAIQRDVASSLGTSTSLAGNVQAAGKSSANTANGMGGASNASVTQLSNRSHNHFWSNLIGSLQLLIDEESTSVPATKPQRNQPGPAASSAQIMAHQETGLISIRANQRQHARIAEFIERLMGSARRQVLLEATIVEVDLSERYQQGIDWSLMRNNGRSQGSGLRLQPEGPVSNGMQTGGLVSSLASLSWQHGGAHYDISAILKLLASFGELHVLSTPKLSMLNNQTSLLKVVDNEVYFTIDVNAGSAATATSPAVAPSYKTQLNSIPIGLLMSVTAQISESGAVVLNLRPSISRISGYALDPNPILAQLQLSNPVPIVQTREMESIMRVQSGDLAVLGGLMQDSRSRKHDGLPGLQQAPWLANTLSFRDNERRKSELVVFLRPTVIEDASIHADYRQFLPWLKSRQQDWRTSQTLH